VNLPDYLLFVRGVRITKEKLEELNRNYEIYLKKLREYEEALNKVKEREEFTVPKDVTISTNENSLSLSGVMLGKDLEKLIRYILGRKDIAIKNLEIINERIFPIYIENTVIPVKSPIKFTIVLEKAR